MKRPPRRTEAEVEWALRDWLQESVEELPDGPALPAQVRSRLIRHLTTTPQRRRWLWDLWRTQRSPASRRIFGFAAFIAAGAIGVGALMATLSQQRPVPPSIVVAQDGSGDFRTLTEAVAAADDGDIILVRPGHYRESVTVTDDITIRGDGDRDSIVLEGPAEKPAIDDPFAISLIESEASLSGMTFSGMPAGVIVKGGAPTLEDLAWDGVGPLVGASCTDARGCAMSLAIDQGSGAVLRDSLFIGGMGVAIFGDADPLIEGIDLRDGPVIWFWDAGDGAILRETTISGASYHAAIGIAGPTTMRIEGNTISGGDGFGINVQGDPGAGLDPVITGNVIRDNKLGGIEVMAGANPVIEDNTISNGESGIRLVRSEATVKGDEITGQTVGIGVFGGAPRIEGNTLDSNKTAIHVQGGTPVIEGNSLCDNEADHVVDGVSAPLPAGNSACTAAPSARP